MWFIGAEVEQETSAPPPKKHPGSTPGIRSIPGDKHAWQTSSEHANKVFLLSGTGEYSPMYVSAAPKDLCAVLV